jgi:hypothetical protein
MTTSMTERQARAHRQLHRLQPYPGAELRALALLDRRRYFHNGGQWADDAKLNFGDGDFNVRSTGWGGYFVVGYNFSAA